MRTLRLFSIVCLVACSDNPRLDEAAAGGDTASASGDSAALGGDGGGDDAGSGGDDTVPSGDDVQPSGDADGECGGPSSIGCGKDENCIFPDGTCDVDDRWGTCIPVSGFCQDVYDPVCSCDNETHSNRCEAEDAGASIDSMGACK